MAIDQFFLMLRQLARDCIEYRAHALCRQTAVFTDVLPIQFAHQALGAVRRGHVPGGSVGRHRLRHAANQRMYSRHRRDALRCSESGNDTPDSNAWRIIRAKASSPIAHRNSSKSIGHMRMDSSSEGIRMSLALALMEISEPVSM